MTNNGNSSQSNQELASNRLAAFLESEHPAIMVAARKGLEDLSRQLPRLLENPPPWNVHAFLGENVFNQIGDGWEGVEVHPGGASWKARIEEVEIGLQNGFISLLLRGHLFSEMQDPLRISLLGLIELTSDGAVVQANPVIVELLVGEEERREMLGEVLIPMLQERLKPVYVPLPQKLPIHHPGKQEAIEIPFPKGKMLAQLDLPSVEQNLVVQFQSPLVTDNGIHLFGFLGNPNEPEDVSELDEVLELPSLKEKVGELVDQLSLKDRDSLSLVFRWETLRTAIQQLPDLVAKLKSTETQGQIDEEFKTEKILGIDNTSGWRIRFKGNHSLTATATIDPLDLEVSAQEVILPCKLSLSVSAGVKVFVDPGPSGGIETGLGVTGGLNDTLKLRLEWSLGRNLGELLVYRLRVMEPLNLRPGFQINVPLLENRTFYVELGDSLSIVTEGSIAAPWTESGSIEIEDSSRSWQLEEGSTTIHSDQEGLRMDLRPTLHWAPISPAPSLPRGSDSEEESRDDEPPGGGSPGDAPPEVDPPESPAPGDSPPT